MYYLYALLTAPGVIIHELAHALFCLLAGVRIQKIKLFQFGNPAGYVIHEEPDKFYQSALVTYGPLLVNSFVSLVCFARFKFYNYSAPNLILLWLGIAIGLHAIPSSGDAKTLVETINRRIRRNPLLVIGYPLAAFIYLLNFLKRIHFQFILVGALFWLGQFYLKT